MMIGRNRWVRCLVGALALCAVSGSAHADVAISENANRHFKEGVRYLTTRDPDRFEKAHAQFRAAYADSPSWKILGNLGIVAEELERDGEAIEAYRGYLEGGAKELSASERKQFTADLNRLELGSARVQLKVEPEGAWIIDERAPEDGKPIVNRYGPSAGPTELRLRAGRHRLHAELNGHASETWELEALPGADAAHDFELRAASPRPPTAHPEPVEERSSHAADSGGSQRIFGYGALGLAGVGAGLGTYFLIHAYQLRNEGASAYDQCKAELMPMMTTPPSCTLSDQKTEDETHARVLSGVSFGVAGALVATGILLIVYSGPSGAEADEAALLPWVGPGQVGVSGSF
jgi:hypothetical protein